MRSMATFRTNTMPPSEAAAFEAQLRASGYREKPGATAKLLLPREYSKRTTSSNPASFGGPELVTFDIRD